MNYQDLSTFDRYLKFLRERFPLSTHLPMILAFAGANIMVGTTLLERNREFISVVIACLITFLFFLRLRLFDELKDQEYDKTANPTRPLVRGLVTSRELLHIIFLSVILEFLLVVFFSPEAIFVYLAALSFSLLMFKEFFIGSIIRPHLTTYAVLHTFVSVLMGYMTVAVSHQVALSSFPTSFVLFSCINWALFNVFEFARKTFSKDEERRDVETYSSKFSSCGAILLTVSQILIVIFATLFLMPAVLPLRTLWIQISLAATLAAGMGWYLTAASKRSAFTYRTMSGAYIVLAYLGFVIGSI